MGENRQFIGSPLNVFYIGAYSNTVPHQGAVIMAIPIARRPYVGLLYQITRLVMAAYTNLCCLDKA